MSTEELNKKTKKELIDILLSDDKSDEVIERAWVLLTQLNLNDKDFSNILRNSSISKIHDTIWQVFVSEKKNNKRWLHFIHNVGLLSFQKKALDILLNQNPTNSELTELMFHNDNFYLINIVSEILLQRNAGIEELINIFRFCYDEDLRKKAFNDFLEKKPDSKELIEALVWLHEYQMAYQIWETLKEQTLSKTEVIKIIENTKFDAFKINAWKVLEKKGLTNSELIDEFITIDWYDEKIVNGAWEMVLRQNPAKHELYTIITKCHFSQIVYKAWELIEKQSLSNYELSRIIDQYRDADVGNDAAKILIGNNPNNYELISIIQSCNDFRFRSKAATILMKQNPLADELICIIIYSWDFETVNDAFELFLEKDFTNKNLIRIIDNCPVIEVVKKAFEVLIKNNPTKEDLNEVISRSPVIEIKKRALKILEKSNLSNQELVYLLRWCGGDSDEIRNDVSRLLITKNPSIDEMKDILSMCTDPEIGNNVWKILEKQNPSNEDLRAVIYIWRNNTHICPNDKGVINKAAKTLLEKEPSDTELYTILEECSDPEIVNNAKKVLLETSKNPLDIFWYCTNHEIINNTWKILKNDNPTPESLVSIINNCEDEKVVKEAWELLRKFDDKKYAFLDIVIDCNDIKIVKEAWKLLVKFNYSKDVFVSIVRKCADIEIVNEAWKKIEKEELDSEDLCWIMKGCIDPEIKKSAMEEMQGHNLDSGRWRYIITDNNLPAEFRNGIWKILAARAGITKPFNEEPLIQKLLSKLGNKFDHNRKKIMFDQVCREDEEIMKIEKRYRQMFDILVLPNYFYQLQV